MAAFHRVHALTSFWSGYAGEARAAAELTRCGLRVAKPFWNDDEWDLVLLLPVAQKLLPLPVQVKSVQFLGKKDSVYVQGLKRCYLDRNPGLCLILYRPDQDAFWFLAGAETIKKHFIRLHRDGEVAYERLLEVDDVALRVDHDDYLPECKMPREDAAWLSKQLDRLATELSEQQELERQMASLLAWPNRDQPTAPVTGKKAKGSKGTSAKKRKGKTTKRPSAGKRSRAD